MLMPLTFRRLNSQEAASLVTVVFLGGLVLQVKWFVPRSVGLDVSKMCLRMENSTFQINHVRTFPCEQIISFPMFTI